MNLSPRLLLYPFSLMFCIIARTRNFLFDKGLLKSVSYPIPVISVGNITVGGTGKTPITEYLVKLLASRYHCALLSRGYGRSTRGPILAGEDALPETIGDEPMQMKMKFPDLTVAVAEKRVAGMEKLLALPGPPGVVLLDDAFQHRSVTPGLSILVTDYYRPMYKDFCLPAGNLREPLAGKKRAGIIVVNKCPENLTRQQGDAILAKLNPRHDQEVFFSSVSYQAPVKLNGDTRGASFTEIIKHEDVSIVAIAGIGNPAPFFEAARKYNKSLETITFPDHHDFSNADIARLGKTLKDTNSVIVTTEKDAVRLKHKNTDPALFDKIWYIPIEIKILFNQEDIFNKTVKNYVKTNQRDS